AHLALARVYQDQGEPGPATAALDRAVTTAERLRAASQLEPGELAGAYLERARFRLDRKEENGALEDCDHAIRAAEKFPSVLAEGHALRGRVYQGRRQFREAAAEYEAAVKARPDYADAHRLLGEV